MTERLTQAWLRRGPLACALWPLSAVYGLLVRTNSFLYRVGIRRGARVPVPVLVVGNIVAGGAGKTPVVMELVRALREQGWRPGVISRGYGRKEQLCVEVFADSDPSIAGDEPLLIKRSTAVPVFVARQRAQAARALLSAYPGTNLIICDDGLQHQAMHHDLSVCVFDERLAGNGWLLPAGPLRQQWCQVGWTLFAGQIATVPVSALHGAFRVGRRLAGYALTCDGNRIPLQSLAGKPLHALAGIARPQAFFDMLRAEGLDLASTQALPDHFRFESGLKVRETDMPVVCTEKDAVKLWPTAPYVLAVPLKLELDPKFIDSVDQCLRLL